MKEKHIIDALIFITSFHVGWSVTKIVWECGMGKR
jgi:hypothetical protein